jgi:molecular chaperone GrpE
LDQPTRSTDQENTSGNGHDASASDLEQAQKRIAELEAQVKEKENKYLYLYADFDNFKKRSIKERSDLLKYGAEGLARDLLQVIDNLERALEHMPKETDSALASGLHMVLNQFKALLEKQGVQHIDAVTKDFDPNFHEAVGQEETEGPSGKVVKEHMRGYTMHGRLLRPSRVVVSGGKS